MGCLCKSICHLAFSTSFSQFVQCLITFQAESQTLFIAFEWAVSVSIPALQPSVTESPMLFKSSLPCSAESRNLVRVSVPFRLSLAICLSPFRLRLPLCSVLGWFHILLKYPSFFFCTLNAKMTVRRGEAGTMDQVVWYRLCIPEPLEQQPRKVGQQCTCCCHLWTS